MDWTPGSFSPYYGHRFFAPEIMAMDKTPGINFSTNQVSPVKPGGPKKRGALRWLGLIFFWSGLSLVLIVAQVLIVLYLYWSHDVPTAAEIRRDGLAINSEKYEGLNHPLPLAEIPPMVQKAFVAMEDAGYYDWQFGQGLWGFVYKSYICSNGRTSCCGSTIVQQVARLKQPGSRHHYDRLIKLPILTWRLETGLTNDEILEIYLNQVYLGRSAFGVEAAAQTYYGKSISDVSISEAAQLAGLTREPNNNPVIQPDRAERVRLIALDRMLDAGFITDAQAIAAKNETIVIKDVSK